MKENLLQLLVPDIEQMRKRNLSAEMLSRQIERLKVGPRKINLEAPAGIGNGILRMEPRNRMDLAERYREHLRQNTARICKFVPASGAATRMFGFLAQEKLNPAKGSDPIVSHFFNEIGRFPFFPQLLQSGLVGPGPIDRNTILTWLLEEQKLSQRPKALLPFHLHQNLTRTPLHEHVRELIGLASGMDRQQVLLHLTVSPEHRQDFIAAMDQVNRELGAHIPCTFSTQMPQTDTVALDEKGRLLRTENGEIVFRPGGHGALIHNLDGIDAELIFIKNIDNVPHPEYGNRGLEERQAMAGLLLRIRQLRDQVIQAIDAGHAHTIGIRKELTAAASTWPGFLPADFTDLLENDPGELRRRIDRPIRICGMVPNAGEPGGGPFWVRGRNGQKSLQIVEQAQISLNDPIQAAIFNSSTHFNPVDMVCCPRNPEGARYPLMDFVDQESDFITTKSHMGQTIRVLEHPGLWNGAMANWLTLFVEMEPQSFCPVKTVNDLLRPCHQPSAQN